VLRKGETDVDRFLEEIPVSQWEELVVASKLIDDFEDWQRTPARREKDYQPPNFEPVVKVRRKMSGEPY
jgi:hypothetical protein